MQRYSKQFRNTILQKMIGPEKRSAPDLAAEYGVSAATIYGWKSKLKDGTLNLMADDVSNKDRSPSEKFALVLEARSIPEEEYGEWLRRNGLHSEHIALWEQELRSVLAHDIGAHDRQLKDVRKELKKKDKELKRKEKAITEMATIIALQKKTALLFPDHEDE